MQLEQALATRILLKDHHPLHRRVFYGKLAIAVGLFFVIMGLSILFIRMGWIAGSPFPIYIPLWVLGVGGGTGVSGGIWLIVFGFEDLQRIRNRKHGQQQLPTTPWLWDYPWQAWGSTDNYLKSALRSLAALILFSLFLSPFHWIAFSWEERSFFWQGIVGLLDLVIILSVGDRFVAKLKQYLRFGNSQLAFNDFPFFLGNPMSLTLKNVPTNISTFHLTLRCIEEVYLSDHARHDTRSVVVCYQLYQDIQILEPGNGHAEADLDMLWILPDDTTLSSTPSERPATYWELEVTAEQQGVHYQSRFLLPIYSEHIESTEHEYADEHKAATQ
ncbi:hypothetical protein [Nitrospira sp. M1]